MEKNQRQNLKTEQEADSGNMKSISRMQKRNGTLKHTGH